MARILWIQAVWRIMGLRLSQLLRRDGKGLREKLAKYEMTRQVYGQCLWQGRCDEGRQRRP